MDDPSQRALAISRRPVHVRYQGDVTAAAAWKHYALKQRKALLWAGDAAMTRVFHPAPGVEVRVATTGAVDFITIQAGLADVGLVLEGRTNPDNPTVHQVVLEDKPPAKTPKFRHPFSKKPLLGGNIDWTDTTGKVCLTWKGPLGRSIGARIESFRVDVRPSTTGGDPSFSAVSAEGIVRQLRYVTYVSEAVWQGAKYYAVDPTDKTVWSGGKVFARAPTDHVVLGAAKIRHVAAGQVYRYVVLVTRPDLVEDRVELLNAPAFHTVSFWWTRAKSGSTIIQPGDWTRFHQAELHEYQTLPMMGFVAFSGSGLKFAMLVPVRVEYAWKYPYEVNDRVSPGRGNDLIVRGEISPDADGLAMKQVEIVPQPHAPAEATGETTINTLEGSPDERFSGYHPDDLFWDQGVAQFERTQSDAAVVAIDFIGEQSVALEAGYESSYSSRNEAERFAVDVGEFYQNDPLRLSGANEAAVSELLRIVDVHRDVTTTVWAVTANQSGQHTHEHAWEYVYDPGGQGQNDYWKDLGISGSGDNQASDVIVVNRPVYYDLRHGTALFEYGEAMSTIISSGSYSPSARSGLTQYQMQLGKQVVDHTNKVRWETARAEDRPVASTGFIWAINSDLSGTFDTFDKYPVGQQAGGGACHDMARPWLQQWSIKPGAVDGITYVDRYAATGSFISLAYNLMYMPYYPDWQIRRLSYGPDRNVNKSYATLPLHAQRGAQDEALVARVTRILSTPDLDNWVVHFASQDQRNCLFATGFKVDAAWQAHLDAAHKEPPVTATALEAELKPLFRM